MFRLIFFLFSRGGRSPCVFFPIFSYPVLLFLGLFENTKENLQNTKDFSHRANPQKPCKTSRKHSKRPRKFPRTKTPRKQKHQGKEGQSISGRRPEIPVLAGGQGPNSGIENMKRATHQGKRATHQGPRLRTRRPPTGVFGPFGPEVPPEVAERVSPKSGVCLGVSERVLQGSFETRPTLRMF